MTYTASAWSPPRLERASAHPGYEPQRTNPLAFWALIVASSGFLLTSIAGGIAGIVLGGIALGKIRSSGEAGRGYAIAGIVLGAFCVIAQLILVIAFLAMIFNSLPR